MEIKVILQDIDEVKEIVDKCVETIEKQSKLERIYLDKLKRLQEKMDYVETRHIAEDELLCELLIELGLGEIVNQYAKTVKWYA